MASARDVIPIALAGLAGALGGRPAASGINQAAQTSRQMRLDKETSARRDQAMAQSARQLELAEEAAKRAERGTRLAESRETRYAEEQERKNKERERERAHVGAWATSWKEANPDADPFWTNLADLMESKDNILKFETMFKEQTGKPTSTEAAEMLRALNIEPGERVSIPLAGGGTLTRTGVQPQENVSGLTPRQLSIWTRQADRNQQKKINQAEEAWVDAVEKMNEFDGEQTSAQYLRLQRAAAAKRGELLEEQSPRKIWESREEYYNSKGLGDKYIGLLEQDFFAETEGGEEEVPGDPVPGLVDFYSDPKSGEKQITPTEYQGTVFSDTLKGSKDTLQGIGTWIRNQVTGG